MANKTPYQMAVEKFGKDTADKLGRSAVDPETGYIAQHLNAVKVLLDGSIPCQRCGSRGRKKIGDDGPVVCLPCYDEWMEVGSDFLDKHGYVSSHKKWLAAFQEFCERKPRKVDLQRHNREVLKRDGEIKALFPSYFGK